MRWLVWKVLRAGWAKAAGLSIAEAGRKAFRRAAIVERQSQMQLLVGSGMPVGDEGRSFGR